MLYLPTHSLSMYNMWKLHQRSYVEEKDKNGEKEEKREKWEQKGKRKTDNEVNRKTEVRKSDIIQNSVSVRRWKREMERGRGIKKRLEER